MNLYIISADKELIANVKTAASGLPLKIALECDRVKTAMDSYSANPARIVILDMFLPESTGLDALKTLKKIDESVHIVLLTRIGGRTLLEKAFRHGAADILHYPISPEILRQTLLHRLDRLHHEGTVYFQNDQE